VRLLWTKYFDTRGTAIVHAVSGDHFEAEQWWRACGDLWQVVHAVMGIVNAWANLPVRPRPAASHTVLAQQDYTPRHNRAD